jgi:5'-deoxynucleotidase YfbR-like HD superfamily hydrolase
MNTTYALYRTGHVQRFAQSPEMAWTGQTLGHHQWGVAILMLKLFPDRMNLAVLWEALHHDTGEQGAAEVSCLAKKKYPRLAEAVREAEARERGELGVHEAVLTDEERDMLKLCDGLESFLYASVRTPWVLTGGGWPEMRDNLIGRAWALGVGAKVEGLLREAAT